MVSPEDFTTLREAGLEATATPTESPSQVPSMSSPIPDLESLLSGDYDNVAGDTTLCQTEPTWEDLTQEQLLMSFGENSWGEIGGEDIGWDDTGAEVIGEPTARGTEVQPSDNGIQTHHVLPRACQAIGPTMRTTQQSAIRRGKAYSRPRKATANWYAHRTNKCNAGVDRRHG